MRRKWREIFGEGKYFLRRRRRTEKEKEGKYHGGGKIYAGTKGYTIDPRRSKKKTEINLCFFSLKINISTTRGFRVGFFQPDTNHP